MPGLLRGMRRHPCRRLSGGRGPGVRECFFRGREASRPRGRVERFRRTDPRIDPGNELAVPPQTPNSTPPRTLESRVMSDPLRYRSSTCFVRPSGGRCAGSGAQRPTGCAWRTVGARTARAAGSALRVLVLAAGYAAVEAPAGRVGRSRRIAGADESLQRARDEFGEGSLLVLPGPAPGSPLHDCATRSTARRRAARPTGEAPFQSVEGLSTRRRPDGALRARPEADRGPVARNCPTTSRPRWSSPPCRA